MRNGAAGTAGKLFLELLDEAYQKKAWHGPNLRQSLRGVTAKDAAWRPARGRHNIWEIVLHAAYWKYIVRRRLRGEPRGSFALPGSNWFIRPSERTEKAWRRDRGLLDQEDRKVREAVQELVRSRPGKLPPFLLTGIAFHDVYHAGQIQLLKRLQAGSKRRSRP